LYFSRESPFNIWTQKKTATKKEKKEKTYLCNPTDGLKARTVRNRQVVHNHSQHSTPSMKTHYQSVGKVGREKMGCTLLGVDGGSAPFLDVACNVFDILVGVPVVCVLANPGSVTLPSDGHHFCRKVDALFRSVFP